jgi:hypothetical protein
VGTAPCQTLTEMTRPILLLLAALIAVVSIGGARALDNGVALTPPMGWMSWQYFRAVTDCVTYPSDCLTEGLFHAQADHLVKDGYLAAGYNSLHFDDAVVDMQRDAQGHLQGDRARFPSGLKALGDYLHTRGLQLAIYSDIGTNTCGGYPGSQGNITVDAQTFAAWGSDYLKLDGCYANETDYARDYPAMGRALNATGRPIVYSCSWPAYLSEAEKTRVYPELAKICNLWRQFDDIQNSWDSMLSIVDYWGDNQDVFSKYSGPGQWNDPDMLIIGNSGLSQPESEVQMAMWAIFAAPLIMGNDLRVVNQWQRDILLNKEVQFVATAIAWAAFFMLYTLLFWQFQEVFNYVSMFAGDCRQSRPARTARPAPDGQGHVRGVEAPPGQRRRGDCAPVQVRRLRHPHVCRRDMGAARFCRLVSLPRSLLAYRPGHVYGQDLTSCGRTRRAHDSVQSSVAVIV